MLEYWPWWIGALALSSLTLFFWMILNRTLGVSGSWARIIMWREDIFIEQSEAPFRNNPEMLKDALMGATIAEFGERAVARALAAHKHRTSAIAQNALSPPKTLSSRAPWTAHLTFLVMLVVGGYLSVEFTSGFTAQFDLGELHRKLFGIGFGNWITLVVGGALVGFGTQMAGGCTSGHGLSGCSRLVPASLLATMAFFGSAVVVSFLLHTLGGAAS